jgi:DNA-binding transcriptional ArsR family regulator
MEIVIDFKAAEVNDIFESLGIIENKEAYEEEFKAMNLPMDSDMEKVFETLRKSKEIDREKLRFYFNGVINDDIKVTLGEALAFDARPGYYYLTLENFWENAKQRTAENIIYSFFYAMLSSNDDDQRKVEEECKKICKDHNSILEFLKATRLPPEIKWNIFLLVNEPKKYLKELCEFISDYVPIYNKAVEKMAKAKEKFVKHLQDKIEAEGVDYFKSLLNFTNFEDYHKIIIAPVLCNYSSLMGQLADENTLILFMGFKFEEALKHIKGFNDLDTYLNTLKTISDVSRYNIIKLLKEKERYGLELAEKLNLTTATISHHMNFLQISNLVVLERKEGKVYYKLNKEPLVKLIDYLKRDFHL